MSGLEGTGNRGSSERSIVMAPALQNQPSGSQKFPSHDEHPRPCKEHLQSEFYSREVVLATIALKIEAKFDGLRVLALVWRKKKVQLSNMKHSTVWALRASVLTYRGTEG